MISNKAHEALLAFYRGIMNIQTQRKEAGMDIEALKNLDEIIDYGIRKTGKVLEQENKYGVFESVENTGGYLH